MATNILKCLGFSKRENSVACMDEESGSSTPLKEKISKSVVDSRPLSNNGYVTDGKIDQWTEKVLPSLLIPPELWLNDSPGAKLLWAIVQENEKLFKSELSKLSNIDIKNTVVDGEGLLHIVCHKKNESFLRMLTEKGIFLNSVDSFGMTPLHLSVYLNWFEGVNILLDAGASPDYLPEYICEEKGFIRESPILTATRKGNVDIVEALLAKLSKYDEYTLNNNSIFHLGSYSQNHLVFKFLIKMKEKLTKLSNLNNDDESPLHTLFKTKARLSSDEEIVKIVHLLLHNNVHINLRNNKGEFPLYLAAKAGLPKVVSTLLQYGADVTLKTKNNENILHAACKSSKPEVLKCLLGTNRLDKLIKESDTSGILPFHIAARNSSVDCCLLLLMYGDHLTNTDSAGITRFSFAMTNMSNGEALMGKVLNDSIRQNKNVNEMSENITLDFSSFMAETGSIDVQDTIVSQFSNNMGEQLLVHPVIESFLYLKWRKIRPFFYLHLLIYTTFLIVHTYYIVKIYCIDDEIGVPIIISKAIYDLHILLLTFLFTLTFAYISVDFGRYCKHFETYFNIGSLTLACIVVFSKSFGITEAYIRRDVAAVSVFLCWTEFMMLLGRDPSLNGTYILMFTKVAQALLKFLVAFLALLIAFTFCFAVLFHEMTFLRDLPIAFVKILMMMIGEIEYSDFFEFLQKESLATKIIGNIFLVVFIFLITILLASLLISLAVNDLPDLHRQGNIRKLVKQSSYLLSYEKVAKTLGCFHRSKKVNPMKFIMRLCSIDKEITLDMHDKSPIIPKGIIKAAKQILNETRTMKANKELKKEDIFKALSLFRKTHDSDLRRVEKKLDDLREIVCKLVSDDRNCTL